EDIELNAVDHQLWVSAKQTLELPTDEVRRALHPRQNSSASSASALTNHHRVRLATGCADTLQINLYAGKFGGFLKRLVGIVLIQPKQLRHIAARIAVAVIRNAPEAAVFVRVAEAVLPAMVGGALQGVLVQQRRVVPAALLGGRGVAVVVARPVEEHADAQGDAPL